MLRTLLKIRFRAKIIELIIIIKKLVPRCGPLPYSKGPLTSVDKLAEQNGHKAELQALRQEANRGDEIHTGYRIIDFF